MQDASVHDTDFASLPRHAANENSVAAGNAAMRASRFGFVTSRLARIVDWAQLRNRQAALHGNPVIYDPRAFPWVAELEQAWPLIRGELTQLIMQRGPRGTIAASHDADAACDRGWTTYALSDYFARSNDVIAQCPQTWRLVQKVPGLVSAMFSVLEPGQSIPAHRGPYNGLLRLHLGLIVPEPREAVGIRIDGTVCHWDEGRVLIFDDTFEHEARNASNSSRVVLFVDFEKPLKFPARLVNRRLLRSRLFSPFVREGSGIRGWWANSVYPTARALRQLQPSPLAQASVAALPDKVEAAAQGTPAPSVAAMTGQTTGDAASRLSSSQTTAPVDPRLLPSRSQRPGLRKKDPATVAAAPKVAPSPAPLAEKAAPAPVGVEPIGDLALLEALAAAPLGEPTPESKDAARSPTRAPRVADSRRQRREPSARPQGARPAATPASGNAQSTPNSFRGQWPFDQESAR